jgi:hypothetical protein
VHGTAGEVAVVGGYGDVGRRAVGFLHRAGVPVRIGGRDPHAAEAVASELGATARARAVDLTEPASLADFVDGATVVLNCAGPSTWIGDRVWRAARDADAGYVDAASDLLLEPSAQDGNGPPSVVAAGWMPGISGLMCRALAAELDRVTTLTSYAGVRDRFTATGARDYLTDRGNQPYAAWRDGRCVGSGARLVDVELPFFDGRVSAVPVLGLEARRVAVDLGLFRGDWFAVRQGRRTADVLDRSPSLGIDDAVAQLVRASALDLGGRAPTVTLVVEVDGERAGDPVRRTGVLRGRGNAAVTGACAAAATLAVREGRVPPGCRAADTVLDPGSTWQLLSKWGAADVTMFGAGADQLDATEEGVL